MKPEEILSQEEIDALLSAVHRGEVATATTPKRHSADRRAVPYDFRQPSRLSKYELRALHVLHDDFAKRVTASLSGMLRTVVDVELEAVEQIPYAEYVLAIGTPACAFTFNMEPLNGEAVLEVNSPLAFAMIDRLLGGSGAASGPIREFTEIERAIIERIGLQAVVELQQSWQQVGAFVMRILNLETNSQFLQITSPNEVILVASFRLRMGEVTGGMTIGYPYLLLEPLIPRFGAQPWLSTTKANPDAETRDHLVGEILHTPLEVRVVLGQTSVRVRDLLSLAEGSMLALNTGPTIPVMVTVGQLTKFKGKPGVSRHHLAVEITDRQNERKRAR
ncbi:MAG: flagellar motor switch protein FliM [Candidatus Rokubacteria bacterium]|nr:flagellar motor switch protein FliM [Candidatus Rokubacteria bacterium]